MITHNTRQIDNEDAAVLFAAAVKFDQTNDDRAEMFDCSIGRVGYANMFERCRLAAQIIATLHAAEGENWDGVVWFELLEAFDEDSLGARLLHKLDESELDADGVRAVTINWLENLEGGRNG